MSKKILSLVLVISMFFSLITPCFAEVVQEENFLITDEDSLLDNVNIDNSYNERPEVPFGEEASGGVPGTIEAPDTTYTSNPDTNVIQVDDISNGEANLSETYPDVYAVEYVAERVGFTERPRKILVFQDTTDIKTVEEIVGDIDEDFKTVIGDERYKELTNITSVTQGNIYNVYSLSSDSPKWNMCEISQVYFLTNVYPVSIEKWFYIESYLSWNQIEIFHSERLKPDRLNKLSGYQDWFNNMYITFLNFSEWTFQEYTGMKLPINGISKVNSSFYLLSHPFYGDNNTPIYNAITGESVTMTSFNGGSLYITCATPFNASYTFYHGVREFKAFPWTYITVPKDPISEHQQKDGFKFVGYESSQKIGDTDKPVAGLYKCGDTNIFRFELFTELPAEQIIYMEPAFTELPEEPAYIYEYTLTLKNDTGAYVTDYDFLIFQKENISKSKEDIINTFPITKKYITSEKFSVSDIVFKYIGTMDDVNNNVSTIPLWNNDRLFGVYFEIPIFPISTANWFGNHMDWTLHYIEFIESANLRPKKLSNADNMFSNIYFEDFDLSSWDFSKISCSNFLNYSTDSVSSVSSFIIGENFNNVVDSTGSLMGRFWFTEDFNKDVSNIKAGDKLYYGKFYTLKYNFDNNVETFYTFMGEKLPKPSKEPTKDDCIFGGWRATNGYMEVLNGNLSSWSPNYSYGGGNTVIELSPVWYSREDFNYKWKVESGKAISISENGGTYSGFYNSTVLKIYKDYSASGGNTFNLLDIFNNPDDVPWKDYRNDIDFVAFWPSSCVDSEFVNISYDYWCYGMKNLKGFAVRKSDGYYAGLDNLIHGKSAKHMFDGCEKLENVFYYLDCYSDSWDLNVSLVDYKFYFEDISYMFAKTSKLNFRLKDLDCDAITANYAFTGSTIENLDNINFPYLTSAEGMFKDCKNLQSILPFESIPKVNNAKYMYSGCSSLSLNVLDFSDSSITDASYMLEKNSLGAIKILNFPTKLRNAQGLFNNSNIVSLDISELSQDSLSGKIIKDLFNFSESPEILKLGDSNINFYQLKDSIGNLDSLCHIWYRFDNNTQINISIESNSNYSAGIYLSQSKNGMKNKIFGLLINSDSGEKHLIFQKGLDSSENVIAIYPNVGAQIYYSSPPWQNSEVTKIIIKDEIAPKYLTRFFYGMTNVTEIEGLEKLRFTALESLELNVLQGMFRDCRSLKYVKLNLGENNLNKNISSSIYDETGYSISNMFLNCENLERVEIIGEATKDKIPIRNMSYIFKGCDKLKQIDFSYFVPIRICYENDIYRTEVLETPMLEVLDISTWDSFDINSGTVTISDFILIDSTNIKKVFASPKFDMSLIRGLPTKENGWYDQFGNMFTSSSDTIDGRIVPNISYPEGTPTIEYSIYPPPVWYTVFTGFNGKKTLLFTNDDVPRTSYGSIIEGPTQIIFGEGETDKNLNPNSFNDIPWKNYSSTIDKVIFDGHVITSNTSYWFKDMVLINSIPSGSTSSFSSGNIGNYNKLVKQSIKSANYMFENTGFTTVTYTLILGLKNASVKGMFKDCKALGSVSFSYNNNYYPGNKIHNFTNISEMFSGCSNLTAANVTDLTYNNSSITAEKAKGIFKDCNKLKSVTFYNFPLGANELPEVTPDKEKYITGKWYNTTQNVSYGKYPKDFNGTKISGTYTTDGSFTVSFYMQPKSTSTYKSWVSVKSKKYIDGDSVAMEDLPISIDLKDTRLIDENGQPLTTLYDREIPGNYFIGYTSSISNSNTTYYAPYVEANDWTPEKGLSNISGRSATIYIHLLDTRPAYVNVYVEDETNEGEYSSSPVLSKKYIGEVRVGEKASIGPDTLQLLANKLGTTHTSYDLIKSGSVVSDKSDDILVPSIWPVNYSYPSSSYPYESSVPTANIFDLYLARKDLTVEFYDGDQLIRKQTVKYGCKLPAPDNPPEKIGATFKGWLKVKDGSETDTWNWSDDKFTQDMKFYVFWNYDPFSVTFNLNGDQASLPEGVQDSKTIYYGKTYGEDGDLPIPERVGYTFTGWALEPSGETVIDNDTIVNTTENHSIYAQWERKGYTVTFDPQGGMVTTPTKLVQYGDTYGELPQPVYNGHVFNGWFTEPKVNTGNAIYSSSTVDNASDHILYAHYDNTTVNMTIMYYIDNIYDDDYPKTYAFSEQRTTNIGDSVSVNPDSLSVPKYTELDRTDIEFVGTVQNQGVIVKTYLRRRLYQVTFNIDGKTTSQNVKYGGVVKRPETPTKTGYAFDKWLLNGKPYDFDSPVEDNVNLEASWTRNKVYMTLNYDNGEPTGTMVFSYHDIFTEPEIPSKDGHVFVHWVNANNEVVQFGGLVERPMALRAVWTQEVEDVIVHFDTNGGKETIPDQTVKQGSQLNAVNNPTRDGYIFNGWTTRDGKAFNMNSPIVREMFLVASWIKYEEFVVVQFLDWEGNNYANTTVSKGSTAFRPVSPERSGYRFIHWVDSSTGEEFDFNTPIEKHTVLIPEYEALIDAHTVTFKADNGQEDWVVKVEDGDLVARPNRPYKEGFVFKHWSLDGAEYNFNNPVVSDLILTAVYEESTAQKIVEVIFNTDGGSELPKASVVYGSKIYKPNDPVKELYRFVGWFDAEGTEFDFDTEITENIELIAHWNRLYTVSFQVDGGYPISAVRIEEGNTVERPENPVKNGYRFIKWILNDGSDFDFDTPIMRDMTLHAVYAAAIETVTVTFKLNNGDDDKSVVINKWASVVRPVAPEKAGYTFDNWYVGDEVFDFASSIADDITIEAKYVPNRYTITFELNGGIFNEGISSTKTVEYGKAVGVLPVPTQEGCVFSGWYTTQDFIKLVHEDTEYTRASDITLYAKWIVSDIEGNKVIQIIGSDGNPLQFVSVVVKQGNKVFKITQTDENGLFSLANINEGYYNIVVTSNNIVETSIIRVNDNDTFQKVTIDDKPISSILEVNNGTKDVVVGGINELYQNTNLYNDDDKAIVDNGGAVAYKMNVKAITEDDVRENSPALIERVVADGKTVSGYIQMDVSKIRINSEGVVTETIPVSDLYGRLLEIHIPLTKEQLKYVDSSVVYRMHEGEVFEITQKPNVNGAYIQFDGNFLIIKASKFSEYCLAYDIPKYSITIDPCNGTEPIVYDVTDESILEKPEDPYKDGHLFDKWVVEGTNEEFDWSTPIKDDMKIIATYIEDVHTVTIDADNGSEVITLRLDHGSKVTKPQDPEKEGYVFSRWVIKENYITYDFDSTVSSNFGLIALYDRVIIQDMCTVRFKLNNGAPDIIAKVEKGKVTYRPVSPVKENYIFDKWVIDGTDEEFNFATAVNTDIVLSAVYTEKTVDPDPEPGDKTKYYKVVFELDNGEQNIATEVEEGKMAYKPAAPTKSGLVFDKWLIKGTTTEFDFNTKITKDITLIATYKKASSSGGSGSSGSTGGGGTSYIYKYAVTLDPDNGSEIIIENTNSGGKIKKPADPVKEGYIFDKWIDIKTEKEFDFAKSINGNYNLKAVYIKDKRCPSKPYLDVDQSLWYHEAVDWGIDSGSFIGTSVDPLLWSPDKFITRAETATVIARLNGYDYKETMNTLYSDVITNHWATPYINFCTEKQLMFGYGNDKFGPYDLCTREQFALIVYRLYANNEKQDWEASMAEEAKNVSFWANDAMAWCVSKGIIKGNNEGQLMPQKPITRAEACAILMRVVTKNA